MAKFLQYFLPVFQLTSLCLASGNGSGHSSWEEDLNLDLNVPLKAPLCSFENISRNSQNLASTAIHAANEQETMPFAPTRKANWDPPSPLFSPPSPLPRELAKDEGGELSFIPMSKLPGNEQRLSSSFNPESEEQDTMSTLLIHKEERGVLSSRILPTLPFLKSTERVERQRSSFGFMNDLEGNEQQSPLLLDPTDEEQERLLSTLACKSEMIFPSSHTSLTPNSFKSIERSEKQVLSPGCNNELLGSEQKSPLGSHLILPNGREDSQIVYHPEMGWCAPTPIPGLPLYPPSSAPSVKILTKKTREEKQRKILENSRLPNSYLSKLENIVVAGEKTTDPQSEDPISLSKLWMETRKMTNIERKVFYNAMSFEPTSKLGIVNLVVGPQQFDTQTLDHLSLRRRAYGIKVESDSFQALPELKSRLASKNGPDSISNSKEKDKAKRKNRKLNGCDEEHIKSLLAKRENKGGIIGKFENDRLKIYRPTRSPYRVVLYNGDSIVDLGPDSDPAIDEDNILFMVPDELTGKDIKSCLGKEKYRLILECMAEILNGHCRLRGDLVMATIGKQKVCQG